LVIDDLFFMVEGKGGVITCLVAKTGKRFWKDRLDDTGLRWALSVCVEVFWGHFSFIWMTTVETGGGIS
jgi:hypothetical protein